MKWESKRERLTKERGSVKVSGGSRVMGNGREWMGWEREHVKEEWRNEECDKDGHWVRKEGGEGGKDDDNAT